MDDSRIIALYFARDERAIEETQSKYGRYCMAIARRITQNDPDAEEVVSDTYLRVWETVPPTVPDPLKGYLAMIASRLALLRIEKRRAKKRGGEMELIFDELQEVVVGSEGDVVDEIALRQAMERFLLSLNRQNRILFVKRYFYAMPTADIAKELDMKDVTVRVTLHRLREDLRKHLAKEGFSI